MRLSIIVPTYNVADYIEKCVYSLQQQDIPKNEYEIIIINDGSPDHGREVILKLMEQFDNIVFIDQENTGVSTARNNAIAIAKGRYILPIDPDDYVVINCFKAVLEKVEQANLDVLYAAFEIFDINHAAVWRTDYASLTFNIDNGYDGYFAVRGSKVMDPDRSVAILYRMELLKEFAIKYPKDVPFLEDGLFLGKVFAVAKKVGYSNDDFYQRTTRPGSATNSNLFFSEKATQGFLNASNDINSFAVNNNLNTTGKELVNHLLAKFIILALSPSCIKFNLRNYLSIHTKIAPYLGEIKLSFIKYNYRRMIKVLKINKLLFFISYRLLR